LLSVLAVAMKPGSKVKTPCSLLRAAMSSTSGPMVPERTGSVDFFPEATSSSSNVLFVMGRSFVSVWQKVDTLA